MRPPGLAIALGTATSDHELSDRGLQFMMDDNTRQVRRQARLKQSAEERRIAAIEDIADSLMDIKDKLVQIRIGITVHASST